jgi:DNA-binding phage protein
MIKATKMRLKTIPFDVADFLDGQEDIQAYLATLWTCLALVPPQVLI